MNITTDFLTYEEIHKLTEFIKSLKGIDYQVSISSLKNSEFSIEFKEE